MGLQPTTRSTHHPVGSASSSRRMDSGCARRGPNNTSASMCEHRADQDRICFTAWRLYLHLRSRIFERRACLCVTKQFHMTMIDPSEIFHIPFSGKHVTPLVSFFMRIPSEVLLPSPARTSCVTQPVSARQRYARHNVSVAVPAILAILASLFVVILWDMCQICALCPCRVSFRSLVRLLCLVSFCVTCCALCGVAAVVGGTGCRSRALAGAGG